MSAARIEIEEVDSLVAVGQGFSVAQARVFSFPTIRDLSHGGRAVIGKDTQPVSSALSSSATALHQKHGEVRGERLSGKLPHH